ncbi:MAG: hypothetical protein HW421_4135 [Ignavibacteria bacterium]|nr:hypothetical protein [Ignavibacteria bacterium]
MKKFILLVIFLCCSQFLFSQKEANNWFFGHGAGITFNTPDGKAIGLSGGRTFGCAPGVLSDSNGKLLFYYSDTLWNRKHEPMKNSDNMFFFENGFNFSSCIRMPGSDSLYYLFHYKIIGQWGSRFCYSIIDMSQDNGFGAVVEKNMLLPDYIHNEHLLIRHNNGKDIWFCSIHNENRKFISILITDKGFAKDCVLTENISFHLDYDFPWWNPRSSPDGRIIKETSNFYKFNTTTGKIITKLNFESYGAECFFSPDGTKLFEAASYSEIPNGKITIKVSDISSYDNMLKRFTRTFYKSTDFSEDTAHMVPGWFQNGPDGNLYLGIEAYGSSCGHYALNLRSIHSILRINNPNEFWYGGVNKIDTVDLGKNSFHIAFPNVLHDYFNVHVWGKADAQNICVGDTIKLSSISKPGVKYDWYGPNDYHSNEQNPFIPNADTIHSGIYKVKVTLNGLNGWSDEIDIKVNPLPKAEIIGKTVFCEGDSVFLQAKSSVPGMKYRWSNGSTSYGTYINKGGMHYVDFTDTNGCANQATIEVIAFKSPQAQIRQEKPLCKGGTTTLRVITDDKNNKLFWSTGETKDTITISEEKKYSLIVTSSDGCRANGEIDIKAVQLPTLKITGKTHICDGAPAELSTDIPFAAYKWSTGETTRKIIVTKTGSFSVDVIDSNGCSGSAVVEVRVAKGPGFRVLGTDKFCKGESVKLSTDADFASYKWSTGETTKSISVNKSGKYFLTVTDTNNCTAIDSITIREMLVKLDGIKDLSFSKVSIDSIKELSLLITNTGTEETSIDNIKTNSKYFTSKIDKQILKPNEFGQLTVLFSHTEPLIYEDSLVIEIIQPCYARYSAYLQGAGTADILAWLPELTGEVGQLNLEVPLYGKITNTRQLKLKRDFNAEVRYDYSALKPAEVQPNGTKVLGVIGIENGMEFRVTVLFTNSEQKIGSFFGDVMLALQDTTPLLLKKFEIQDTLLNINTLDGSFILQPVCKTSLRRITTFEKVTMTVLPNPAGDAVEVRITGSEQGNFTLNIYTIEGIKIESFQFSNEQNKIFEKKFQINTENYPSGIYFIILNKPMGVERERLNVVK